MITGPGSNPVSLPGGSLRWTQSALVPPTQEAGWADQNPARDNRQAVAPVQPIPFANHLEQSNEITRQSDSYEFRVRPQADRCPLGDEEATHPLVAAGNDRNRLPCAPAQDRPEPVTTQITRRLRAQALSQTGLKAVAAYEPRPRYEVGRLLDVIV